jgi:hypothetical protein
VRRVLDHHGAGLDSFPAPTTGRITVIITPHRVVATG